MDLTSFERQHKNLYEVMDKIDNIISATEIDAVELAKLINRLAGRLNIHLSSEDRHLYPALLEEQRVSAIAKRYMDEMGGVLKEFTEYREKNNTKTKILENMDNAVTDTKHILKKIRNRINKEDKELYPLVS